MLISELLDDIRNGSFAIPAKEESDDSIFLARVHELERMYDLRWWEFQKQYAAGSLVGDSPAELRDFAEWDLLCNRFSGLLVRDLFPGLGPPSEETYSNHESPSNRAFVFC